MADKKLPLELSSANKRQKEPRSNQSKRGSSRNTFGHRKESKSKNMMIPLLKLPPRKLYMVLLLQMI